MSVLSDRHIKLLCDPNVSSPDPSDNSVYNKERLQLASLINLDIKLEMVLKPMIEPFVPHQVKTRVRREIISSKRLPTGGIEVEFDEQEEKIVSYGLSSYGYDLRCGNKFKIFTNVKSSIVDPKDFCQDSFVEHEGDVCIIPPNSFVLCASLERINMPRDVTGVVLGKSTYARCGISCLATPLEAGWEGHVTLEFANTTPLPAKLYAGEGCCQVLFYTGSSPCDVSYADRNGKYQNQAEGPVTPRM